MEENSGVDTDQVASAHLLEHLEEHAKHEAVEELVLAHGENVLHANGGVTSLFESELNATNLSSNQRVVLRETTELGKT